MKTPAPNYTSGRARTRVSRTYTLPSPSDFHEVLGLAEIYLEDGAPVTALQLIREALELSNPCLADDEDLGDVSDHLLERVNA